MGWLWLKYNDALSLLKTFIYLTAFFSHVKTLSCLFSANENIATFGFFIVLLTQIVSQSAQLFFAKFCKFVTRFLQKLSIFGFWTKWMMR